MSCILVGIFEEGGAVMFYQSFLWTQKTPKCYTFLWPPKTPE